MILDASHRRYLDFEEPLVEFDIQIAKLKQLPLQGRVDVSNEIKALEQKAGALLNSIFSNLTAYQVVQLSRHPNRPTTLDYIEFIFHDFVELRGDRVFMDDPAIVGGLASFGSQSVMVIGNQKGRNTQENMLRNFGMSKPEGYRKAHRLMRLAERWKLPVITLIDTPGAYPGIDAEERGQAVAIAENILLMTSLEVPILSVILGEGGSGGALAIGVADRLLMMQYATYSVISPEGCAAITWKDGKFASQAAEALKLTAKELVKMKIVDEVLEEPLGGAHRDSHFSAQKLKLTLEKELTSLIRQPISTLLKTRYQRYRNFGFAPSQGAAQSRSNMEKTSVHS